MDEKRDRYLFLCGNNIDKALQMDVQRNISQNKDAKRLIKFGTWKLCFSFIFVALSLAFLIIGFYQVVQSKEYIEYFDIASVIAFILCVKFMYNLLSDIKSLKEQGMELVKYIRYLFIFSKDRPKSPLDIWCQLPGSLVDAQMINTIHKIVADNANEKVEIDVMYTGIPYYDVEFIYNVYVRWEDGSKGIKAVRRQFMRWWHARYKFFAEYSFKTVIAIAKKEYFNGKVKKVSFSNAIFGILFSSTYFKSELDRIDYFCDKKIKIDIDIDDDEDKKWCTEWIKSATASNCFTLNEEDKGTENKDYLKLKIVGIKRQGQRKAKRKWGLGVINIPVTRFYVYPRGRDNLPKAINPYPATLDANFKYKVFCLGGAEQNMALQHIVTEAKWSSKDRIQGYNKIGIAENVFDELKQDGFLVGTEGLVYGIREKLLGRRVPDQDNSCRAEVYNLKWKEYDNIDFYGVYGYSAMATKIALCYLIYGLSSIEGEIEKEICQESWSQLIPGHHIEYKTLLDYFVADSENGTKKVFETCEGIKWDEEDMMNHIDKLFEHLIKEGKTRIVSHR